jgi:hypothetical protein
MTLGGDGDSLVLPSDDVYGNEGSFDLGELLSQNSADMSNALPSERVTAAAASAIAEPPTSTGWFGSLLSKAKQLVKSGDDDTPSTNVPHLTRSSDVGQLSSSQSGLSSSQSGNMAASAQMSAAQTSSQHLVAGFYLPKTPAYVLLRWHSHSVLLDPRSAQNLTHCWPSFLSFPLMIQSTDDPTYGD